MNKGTTVAFIVTRLGSSRFPGKQLRTIGGISILQWIVDALGHCRQLDRIVLATVARQENEPLQQWASQRHIDCFWYEGPTDHVTTRLRKAAEHFTADICLLISADCPLIDPVAIDTLISDLQTHPEADYTSLPNDGHDQSCMLQGVQVARRKSWQRGDDLSDRPELKEHQIPIFAQCPDLFNPLPCRLDPTLYGRYHRLSVDTWSDLNFLNQVYTILREQGQAFSLGNVVSLLRQQPHLKKINQHVHQKRLVDTTQRVLIAFSIPPQPDIFSHSQHLALQIIDRLGWPVTMLNTDLYYDQLKETGIRIIPIGDAEGGTISASKDQFDLLLLVLEEDLPSWWLPLSQDLASCCLLASSQATPPLEFPSLPLPQQGDDEAVRHLFCTLKAITAEAKTHA